MSFWSRVEKRITNLAGELIPDDFRLQITAARDLLASEQPREAIEMLTALLGERPAHVGALTLLGAAHMQLEEFAPAHDAFTRATAVEPDAAEANLGLGQAMLALGDAASAIAPFRATVRDARGDRGLLAEAYRGLGIAHRRSGNLDKAVRELRKAVAEDPDDVLARAALGEALLLDDRISADEARTQLERALESDDAPALAHLALARIDLSDGNASEALDGFERARQLLVDDPTPPGMALRLEALVGLADTALASDGAQTAHHLLVRALELDPQRASLHARVADALRSMGDTGAALASYERALELGADNQVRQRALALAVEAEATETAVRLANDALARDPEDTRALVARGMALAQDDQGAAARATFELVLAHGDDFDAHLALGRLLMADTREPSGPRRAGDEALAALRLRPNDARARALLERARGKEFGRGTTDHDVATSAGDAEMYRLALDLQELVITRPALAALAGEAAQAAADFDRPLLVTVMGEFSSGKSTFVNAFIGAEVAPTGITPTTATINVVKYGRERGGRIVYLDGRIEELAWERLFEALRNLDAQVAATVQHVEILLPLEQLERVNIVDTPGLNSILPEHETVARGFFARADAVVWLFTANQAGKKSEREALESIRGEEKRVLGVLNKTDQLSAAERTEVVAYVTSELGELVEVVVPLAAREAFSFKQGASESDGNWSGVADALEQRFFARARQIKREACNRRIGQLIGRALDTANLQRTRAMEAATALVSAGDATEAGALRISNNLVPLERQTLVTDGAALCREAAREVLELVQPRSLPFGSHSATAADRDYLLSLLDSGYEALLEASRRRVGAALDETGRAAIAAASQWAPRLGPEITSDLERTVHDAVRLVDAQVFERCRAYLRGYVRGGYVDSFFHRELPKIELEEDAIYHALFRDSPDIDREIGGPLAVAGQRAMDSIAERLAHWASVADVLAFDIEVGIARALETLDATRRALVSS